MRASHCSDQKLEHRARVIPLALVAGLFYIGFPVTGAQAQLGPCTPVEELRGSTTCESPREHRKSAFETLQEGLRSKSREALRDSGTTAPLLNPGFTNDPSDRDPIAQPSQPPLRGARDYLNRQDPALAIHPIEPIEPIEPIGPGTSHLSPLP